MLTLLINESNPLDGLFANSTTGGVGTVPDITVADDGQAVSVQSFTRAGGIITDSFVAGDALHIGIGDGVNAPVCYVALSSASPAVGTMPINTAGMVALFAATVANQLSLTLAVVRTRGAYTNTIFSAPIVIRRSAINISTAVPTPSILGTGVSAALQVAINTALGFVRLDSSARLPAVDGSQLTNLPNTGGVTSITGTANEITVTGTTTPTLSLPSALTFTGKTVTGGTFASPTFTTPAIGDGTEAAPSLSFTSDTNTGVYRPAADTVGIVGGGNDVVRLTGIASATDYLEIKNGIGVGSPLHVLAEGASANIGVHLQPKGSGLFTISDGTDFAKGIRFRSSSSAASAITLLDAVSTAGRVVTLPDATGTLALVSGNLGTPSAIVLTNASGTAASLTAGTVTTNANLTGHVTSVGNAAVLGSFTMAQLSAAVSDGDPAYVAAANTFTAANTFNQAATFTSGIHATKIQLGGTAGATIGIDIVPLNTPTQPIAGRSWMRVGGVSSESLMINAGLTGGYVDLCTDLGSGVRVWDGTGGHVAYLTPPATGTLRVTTNGSTLGTVDAATFTGNAATATKWTTGRTIALTGDVTYTSGALDGSGNVTGTATLANIPAISGANLTTLNASNVSSGTLADARLSSNVPLKDAANTFTGTTNTFTLPTTTGTTTTSGIAIAGNSLTTGTGIYLASSTLTSGKAMDIQVSGTAAAASQTALNVATAGANGTSGITTKGAVIANTHTGTTSTNTALELTASGGTTNVALNATAGHVLVPDGSYAYNTSVSPSIGRSAVAANSTSQAGILLGDNTVSILTNSIRGFTISGYGAFGNGALISGIGTGSLTFYQNVIATSVLQAGEDKTSTPNTGTVRGGSGSGTNIAGGALHIQGGASTGSAAGGSILLRTTPAGGSGSSANAAVTALTIDSTQAATFAGTLAVTGATTLTGNLTSNGALISTPQVLTGAGAVNVTTLTTAVTTTAPAQALTLADGTNGQIKTIVHQALSGGGTWVLTPTTKTGYTTITSTAVGETCTLQFFTTIGWCILSLRGAIAA